jgi:hypothetical protein
LIPGFAAYKKGTWYNLDVLNFLRFVLLSVLKNVPCVDEKNVYSEVVG